MGFVVLHKRLHEVLGSGSSGVLAAGVRQGSFRGGGGDGRRGSNLLDLSCKTHDESHDLPVFFPHITSIINEDGCTPLKVFRSVSRFRSEKRFATWLHQNSHAVFFKKRGNKRLFVLRGVSPSRAFVGAAVKRTEKPAWLLLAGWLLARTQEFGVLYIKMDDMLADGKWATS